MTETLRLLLRERRNRREMNRPGDYCIAYGRGDRRTVVLRCPVCGVEMQLNHAISEEDGLTVSPSVVGPALRDGEGVRGPDCGHHFWIRGGYAEVLA